MGKGVPYVIQYFTNQNLKVDFQPIIQNTWKLGQINFIHLGSKGKVTLWCLMHSNKPGNKSHKSILRYRQLEVSIDVKNNSSVNFKIWGFYIPYYVFYHFDVISD